MPYSMRKKSEEHIQRQNIPPDINPGNPDAVKKIIDFEKANYKKIYELMERVEELEKVVLK